MTTKLALGTVQFGKAYGVHNTRGQVPREEVFEILKMAIGLGMDTLDTAVDYDQSEEILGEYFGGRPQPFKIITKLSHCDSSRFKNIPIHFAESLARLKQTSLYGLLVHRFEDFTTQEGFWAEFISLKEEGRVAKIGFSLYYPSELEEVLKRGVDFDLLQVPFSILDRRFEPFFPILKKRGIEVHVRSVFLQGLVFFEPARLPPAFEKARPALEQLRKLSKSSGLGIGSLCLNFAARHPLIDRVVIGVDSLFQLKDNRAALDDAKKAAPFLKELEHLAIDDENILLPFKWPKI